MENHTNKTYQERMNQTALSKFGAIQHLLNKNVKILDFGSGFSPDFIDQVNQTGAHYVAYDVSAIVQNQLNEHQIDFLTEEEELENAENEFDVIYLSSVFHELMSYLSRPERTRTFALLDKALKQSGTMVIRDWGPGAQPQDMTTLEVMSEGTNAEVETWAHALIKNSVITAPTLVTDNTGQITVPVLYQDTPQNLYEIIFHVVWGLNSLERESRESYAIDHHLIEKWICAPLDYEIIHQQEEYDTSYLPHLQKYFNIDHLP